MSQRSIYGLFSTITLGVEGTPMVSFRSLADAERWALAFHVAGLGVPAAETARGAGLWKGGAVRAVFPDLESVASLSEAEARARGGDDAAAVLAYLRTEPGGFSGGRGTALATSRTLLEESLAAYRAGQGRRAQELAVASYLDGFELAEASIDTLDRRLRTTVETEMMRYRAMLREGAPLTSVEAQAGRLEELLRRAETLLGTTGLSAGATFTAAFVILLREGLEAILVVAAIIAMLARSGRRQELRYVHLGWIAALAAGGLTWIVASRVVAMSGATREVTEGVTALVAAAMLLYVGVWMHSRTQARRWQSFLDRQLRGAPSGGTLWALTLAAFLAVYREAFETVLFYQTLWAQAGPGRGVALGAGFGAAAVALVFVGWLIVRGSVRLPLGLFFSVSSWALALLAVVLAGQGVAALQEAGWLPASPVDAPSLPALGVYANVESLAVQLALLLLVALIFTWMRLHARRQGV